MTGVLWRLRYFVHISIPLVLALFLLAISVGAQKPAAEPLPEQDLVHFGDVLDVDVVGGLEFDWRGGLNPEGFLEGPDGIGDPVYGLCRSENAIADEIAGRLAKILRDPRVVVRIIDRSNRAVVRLEGAVRTPSRFRLKRPATVRELIVKAGGVASGASGELSIFRPRNLSCQPSTVRDGSPSDNGSQTINIKITDLLKGVPGADQTVLSGDMITVKAAEPVYVIGAVNSPGPLFVREQMTASRAVASAGGVSKEADESRVAIFRRLGADSSTIELDLKKVKRGTQKDEILKPFDIIEVAAKGGRKRKYPPVSVTGSKGKGFQELPLKVIE